MAWKQDEYFDRFKSFRISLIPETAFWLSGKGGLISDIFFLILKNIQNWVNVRYFRETIESGPLCITDLFQNKYVA